MYSRCTHCHTACAVPAETLVRDRGELRCAVCERSFDALLNLTRTLPDDLRVAVPATPSADPATGPGQAALALWFSEADTESMPTDVLASDAPRGTPTTDNEADASLQTLPQAAADPSQPAPEDPEEMDAMTPSNAASMMPTDTAETEPDPPPPEARTTDAPPDWFNLALDASQPEDGDVEAPSHPDVDASVPSFVAVSRRSVPAVAGQRRWPHRLLVALLAVLLLVQCVVAERDTLAAHAQSRPWLEYACAGLGCALPAWHDPAAMAVLTRDVRPHPSVPNALLISASFRNEARWEQAWPGLQLTLSDLDGQLIARRRFLPAEYLGLGAPGQVIQPDQTASITLEVRDPGKQAVAFEFEFF